MTANQHIGPVTAFLLLTGITSIAADLPEGLQQIGTIQAASLRESSGVVVSDKNPQILWSHGDGRRPALYAMDRSGKSVGVVMVAGVLLHDWEDIASDHNGHLYVADIGNNDSLRTSLAVYEIPEPDPAALPKEVKAIRSWKLSFPKNPFDAESLFIWQDQGYVISKVFNNAKASLYRFPLKTTSEPVVLERVSKLRVDSPVTGADISRDGKKIGLVSKAGAAILDVSNGFEGLAETKPVWMKFRHEHVEGCAFAQEGLILTAESREIFLVTAPGFKP